ncbi:hypothetical protein HYH03_005700 [Edaphochlamys debaryana]|uniref:Cytochrome b5 heme-binding domain-containing protein n=1 Tax=Edaphochlamys debaryana TaxID=47281 RepID=A0A835Y445_9CHLO|nr:hypothetical protein HYH03_005700 [Edaphochlamys debaryana]|eukprot:KAG2496097.1 hypothetical protein HYH03_005700 [Edaphochlamys debaryana]
MALRMRAPAASAKAGSRQVAAPCRVARASAVRPGVAKRQLVAPISAVAAPVATTEAPAQTTVPAGGDPWEDEKWTKYKWTVYRDVAYDLTPYLDRHPGGRWLLNLAIGRDATALFESYHLRPEVAAGMLKRLPVLEGFPVDAVPRSPRPNDSELYNAIRERVKKEVFKGTEIKGAHRSGSEWAALCVLGYAALAYGLYAFDTNPLTGFLYGLSCAWIGLTIQHCGNHGAMSTNPIINNLLGLTDDLSGGSSLMWRYHHQVSHHIHCNDDALDEDVFSAFPLLRFDDRLPRAWYHQFQHIYMWVMFPFLQLLFQVGDWTSLQTNRTAGSSLYGASDFERKTVVYGKLIHYGLMYGVPLMLHGPAAMLSGALASVFTQGVVLSTTFAVSHNVAEAKPLDAGPTRDNLDVPAVERDWGVQQVQTSANWGGVIGCFFTGGLNLQIEHHLFPAISFMHYPAIARIVEDECNKRGIVYAKYETLPEIVNRFIRYMAEVGRAPQRPVKRDGEMIMLAKY